MTQIRTIWHHFLTRTFIFWMMLFLGIRILFVVANYRFLEGSLGHKLLLFLAALRLDLATAAYLTLPVFITWLLFSIFKKTAFLKTAFFINVVLIIPVLFIGLLNIANYANWQTVANKRILLYFENPAEVSHFMSNRQLILTPFGLIALIWIVLKLHKRFVKKQHEPQAGWKAYLGLGCCIPLLIVFMRGGIQQLPINESAAYYSVHQGNDHAAVNPVYYFAHSASEYFYVENKFFFNTNEKNKSLVQELMTEKTMDSTIVLTSLENPNLVIILLESWTADVLEELGGEKGITPFTQSILGESFLFSQCYGSGYRTDQGLVSVLAGYPAQPDNSIIAYPDKIKELPTICRHLKNKNYHSSFFYGGDITFAEMKSFIVQQGFDYIFDKENYDPKDCNSKWGAHDGKVLESQINYLNSKKPPFLSCVLTLSTHEPFEVPIEHKFPHDSDPGKFKNSAYYTDQCLKSYFQAAKKTNWYKNTLFLLVADHGHHLPMERSLNTPESKRIVCLLTGGALAKNLQGKKWDHVMNQHDLIKLLAPYFGFNAQHFPFAKNPFTCKNPFAYFANEDVLGFVTDSTKNIYSFVNKKDLGKPLELNYAKAYLQWMYNDFVAR